MTAFDRMTFEQRSYVIQQLAVLVERLKEAHLRDELVARSLLLEVGGQSIEAIQQRLLEFALNHFGQTYSDEARE
jgi:hypothetical protein